MSCQQPKIQPLVSLRPPLSVVNVRQWLDEQAKARGVSRNRMIWDCIESCIGKLPTATPESKNTAQAPELHGVE